VPDREVVPVQLAPQQRRQPNAGADSWLANLQAVVPYTRRDQPLPTQSCWAHPDMLEVGQIMKPGTKELDLPWNQAHFGAWCTVSSPLTLGPLRRGSSVILPPRVLVCMENPYKRSTWS
jgi:hypothetical protein